MQYRMYFFTPYHLSPIQKGIQAGHAALEYAKSYGDSEEYKSFIENDKTWILLDGGTTRNTSLENQGTLNKIVDYLFENKINYECFNEPDLNYALTAVCFLADERVWDFESYPDFVTKDMIKSAFVLFGFEPTEEDFINRNPFGYGEWVKSVGGAKNVALRQLLKGKKLAN